MIYLVWISLKIVSYFVLEEIWNLVLGSKVLFFLCWLFIAPFSLLLFYSSNFVFVSSICYLRFRYFLFYFNLNHYNLYFINFLDLIVKIFLSQNVLTRKVLTFKFTILYRFSFTLFIFFESDVFCLY